MQAGNVQDVASDPCAGMDPISKWFCEKERSGLNTTSGGNLGGILGYGSNGSGLFNFSGGWRHLMLRISEGIVGGLLVIVGLNALVKAGTQSYPVQQTKSTVSGAVKTAKKVVK